MELDSYTDGLVVSVWFKTTPQSEQMLKRKRDRKLVVRAFPSGRYGAVYGPNVPGDGHPGSM